MLYPVSIHASAWEATIIRAIPLAMSPVSIHASAWEATSRLRESPEDFLVSIHASAWEATASSVYTTSRSSPVSIHASAWEATAECRAPNGGPGGFNPRLRVGGDISLPWKFPARQSFNPRLRVGGDPFQADRMATDAGFQSTPPRGRRLCVFLCLVLVGTGFNPRLRVGGDGIRSCILI